MKKIKKSLCIIVCALASVVFLCAPQNAGAAKVDGDYLEIVPSGFPLWPLSIEHGIDIVWSRDDNMEAPIKTEVSAEIINSCDIIVAEKCLLPLIGSEVFGDANLAFPSVGDYTYNLSLNNIRVVNLVTGQPVATDIKHSPQQIQLVVSVRNKDPENLSQGLTAEIAIKDNPVFTISPKIAYTPSFTLAHITSGPIGDKSKAFKYKISTFSSDWGGTVPLVVSMTTGRRFIILPGVMSECESKAQGKEPAPDTIPKLEYYCDSAELELRDGEEAIIGAPYNLQELFPTSPNWPMGEGVMPGAEVSVEYLDTDPNYAVTANGISKKAHTFVAESYSSPTVIEHHSIVFESSRELPVNTGVIVKSAPFVVLAVISGLGIFAIVKHKKRA